jgi:hypothetical protein
MQNIPWQRWVVTCVVLLLLGLAADYYFLHILFQKKMAAAEMKDPVAVTDSLHSPDSDAPAPVLEKNQAAAPQQTENNFLKSLQDCRPDISSQGITTPEALLTYLNKSVGVQSETKDIENYHIRLADGSERRLHLTPSDSDNGANHTELRYFKLDAEGYPERIPLTPEQTLDPKPEFMNSLLSQGKIELHQVHAVMQLKDQSSLLLETRNDRVYEFQLRGEDKTLSCRELNCLCQ